MIARADKRSAGATPRSTRRGRPAASTTTAELVLEVQRTQGNAAVGRTLRGRSEARVLARVDAIVTVGDQSKPFAGSSAKGGMGGKTHAEQIAWGNAFGRVRNVLERRPEAPDGKPLRVVFTVDGLVCEPCQRWFVLTLYPELQRLDEHERGFEIWVERTEKGRTVGQVQVVPGVNWRGVGEGA